MEDNADPDSGGYSIHQPIPWRINFNRKNYVMLLLRQETLASILIFEIK